MDPKPFTYEHFIQTVQSLKYDMLMYYIDEAVAIYCRIKGKSVGPVPYLLLHPNHEKTLPMSTSVNKY